jgi:hypothetical protein
MGHFSAFRYHGHVSSASAGCGARRDGPQGDRAGPPPGFLVYASAIHAHRRSITLPPPTPAIPAPPSAWACSKRA